MMRPWMTAPLVLVLACASTQPQHTSESLFSSPAAEQARQLAPDLYHNAKQAWDAAEEAQRREADEEAEDRRTESRLWFAAAVAEAERVQLERQRRDFAREGEHWGQQLARDREAVALVSRDIARYEASIVALREVNRLSVRNQEPVPPREVFDALMTRVRLDLALAEALGAAETDLRPLQSRAGSLQYRGRQSVKATERLLSEVELLLGRTRHQWPEPLPGASTSLVQAALADGFTADRSVGGVIVRSERFFRSGGQVQGAEVARFERLMRSFPHGPIVCQVAVPELRSRVWPRRVGQFVRRVQGSDDVGRVSAGELVTTALKPGTVQCTFAAYRGP